MVQASELPVDTTATATQMADEIFGDGVQVVSATYTGDAASSGIYTDAETVMPGVAPSDTGVILSTGQATSVTNTTGEANQSAGTSTDTAGVDGDADLNAVAGFATYDAAILEAEFIPTGDTLTMQIVFSSEEYLEYVDSGFNDAIGVWVNGVQAELSVGDGSVSIDNITTTTNTDLYVDNALDVYNTEMDGFTVTVTVKAPVNPGEVNTIKIGIADAGDAAYDSNLFIAGDSVQTTLVAGDDSFNVGIGGTKTIDVLANDTGPMGSSLTITHINGLPVSAGQTVTLADGVQLTLNPDGTIGVVGDDVENTASFSYTVADGAGNTDVALVQVNTMPCFVAGTRIDTALGPRPVEQVAPGDLVLTRDNGFQPVRWAGRKSCITTLRTAPVRIAANTFGSHGELVVSPQHRVMLQGAAAALLFGAGEVLASAIHLLNDGSVRRGRTGESQCYVHLLFDRHEVIRSNGIWSESYLPGPETLPGFDAAAQEEILSLFPMLDPASGAGYGAAARPCLRRFEARALARSFSGIERA